MMKKKPKKLSDFILWDPMATLVVIFFGLIFFLTLAYLLGYINI